MVGRWIIEHRFDVSEGGCHGREQATSSAKPEQPNGTAESDAAHRRPHAQRFPEAVSRPSEKSFATDAEPDERPALLTMLLNPLHEEADLPTLAVAEGLDPITAVLVTGSTGGAQ